MNRKIELPVWADDDFDIMAADDQMLCLSSEWANDNPEVIEYIVNATNYHERLVEALSEIYSIAYAYAPHRGSVDRARTILQELEGEL